MADNPNKKRQRSPRQRKRIAFLNGRKTVKKVDLNSLKLPTKNRFSALAVSNDAMDTNDHQQQQQATPKKVSISPIVVTDHTSNIQAIITELDLNCNIKLNSVGRKIFVNSAEEKKKIIDKLKEKKIFFFSHPDDNNKTFKVILSGLPQVEIALIEESLKEQKLTPTKVTMFNTKSPNKLYLLHFNASEVSKKTLEPIKYVHHHVISWLPFKPKRNGPTQCLKCLMYGHGISSCNRYAVCMLCAGEHLTSACPTHNKTNTNSNTKFSCFNCKDADLAHDHKANAADCPFRLKYEQARNNARSKTATNNRSNANAQHFVPAPQPPPLQSSFADNFRTSAQPSSRTHTNATPSTSTSNHTHSQPRIHTNARHNNTSSHSFATDSSNVNNNTWTFAECANILFDSIERLQQCTTKLDQLKVIADLLQHACK